MLLYLLFALKFAAAEVPVSESPLMSEELSVPASPLVLEKLRLFEFPSIGEGVQAEQPQAPQTKDHSVVVQFLKETVLLVVDVVGILTSSLIRLSKLWLPFLGRIFGEVPLAIGDVVANFNATISPLWQKIWKPLTAPFNKIWTSELFKSSTKPVTATSPAAPVAVQTEKVFQKTVSTPLNSTTTWEQVESKVKTAKNCDGLVASLAELQFSVDTEICKQQQGGSSSFNFKLPEPLRTILVVFVAVILALAFSIASNSFKFKQEHSLYDHVLVKQED